MFKNIFYFYLIVCSIMLSSCTIIRQDILHKSRQYDFTVVNNKDYTIIPIKIKYEVSGVPLVQITLKDKKILLDLDSGGFAPISLPPEMVKMLNLEYTGKSITVYDIRGNKSICKEFIVPELYIGDFKLLNVIGYEIYRSYFKDRPLIGYIGSGILRRFEIITDYPKSKIVLIKKGGSPPEDYQVGNWIRVSGGINTWEVELNNAKYRLRLGWDTGASFSVIKPRREFVSEADDRGIVKFSNLRINNYDFGSMEFAIFDFNLPMDGFLGHNFLESHEVYFDFENDIVRIKGD